jgi:hypothetical protein
MSSTCRVTLKIVGPDLIIGRLKAIRDPRMRVLALVQALGEGDPVAWVEALASIIARAHLVDDADAMATVECVTHAAAEESLPYATRQQLYETATERNRPAVFGGQPSGRDPSPPEEAAGAGAGAAADRSATDVGREEGGGTHASP